LKLYAANETAIPILGQATLKVKLGIIEMDVRFVVTDNLEEVLFGYDWLSQHECQWDFKGNFIVIDGIRFQLRQRPSRAFVRRIYVDQESIVPAYHQANVPVKITCHNPYASSPNWVVEPKAVKSGVITARTLLAEDTPCAAVRVINYSDNPVCLKKETCMGTALPAEVCEPDKAAGQTEPIRKQPETNRKPPDTAVNYGLDIERIHKPLENTGKGVGEDERPKEPDDYGDHLQPLYQSLPADLTREERLQAELFIRDNEAIFSKSEFDIGRTDFVQHQIDTGIHRPFRQSLRRHPWHTCLRSISMLKRCCVTILLNQLLRPGAPMSY